MEEGEQLQLSSPVVFLFFCIKEINLMSNSFENSPLHCVCFLVKIEVSEDCRLLLNIISNFSKAGNQVFLIFSGAN